MTYSHTQNYRTPIPTTSQNYLKLNFLFMILYCSSILMIIQIHVLESTLMLSIDVWFDKFNLVDFLDTRGWDIFSQILCVESLLNDLVFSCEPSWHVKKVSSCKRKIVYCSDSFCFWMMRAQISHSNTKISGLFSSAFLFKAVLLTTILNLVSFQSFQLAQEILCPLSHKNQ